MPMGLNGLITSNVLVGKLTDEGEQLIFVGTSNGLYVVAPGGRLDHFLYSPFGIAHVALLDDVSGDGVRDIVVSLQKADVPMLRCYDGATWQKIWQFAPEVRLFREDVGWVEKQFSIAGLEIAHAGDSQNILITADRSVYCVRGRDGQRLWRFEAPSRLGKMAVLADISGDDADEIAVGSSSPVSESRSGSLYMLDGRTGKVRWEMRLEACTSSQSGFGGYRLQTTVCDVATVDEKTGRVSVTSTDGKLRLVDLREKRIQWDVAIAECAGMNHDILVTPDITGDGLAETAVLNQVNEEEKLVLVDSTGKKVWEKDLHLTPLTGAEIAYFDGKPVVLETKGQELRMIDLASGELTQIISINTLDSQRPAVIKADEDGYLLLGSDLVAISSSGETLWHYPGISTVGVKTGSFTGDEAQDILLCGEYSQSSTYDPYYPEPVPEVPVRLLSVMDGTTHEMVWSYAVPCGELMAFGGLEATQVTPDLVGNDGFQDVIAYRGDRVFIFSGTDGSLSDFAAGNPITSLDVIHNGTAGSAIAVTKPDGLAIFDAGGAELSSIALTVPPEATEGSLVEFRILDDINGDGISDLAVFFADRIEVSKSIGGTPNYESHLTFSAADGQSIEFQAVAPDMNKDGVREMAYLLQVHQSSDINYPGAPAVVSSVLVIRSPVDGTVLLQSEKGLQPACDLACADFNGDGYADSMVAWQQGYSPTAQTLTEARLEIYSGKDGTILWKHSVAGRYYSGPSVVPAIPIGDMNGDGAEDLLFDGQYSATMEYLGGGEWYVERPAYHEKLVVYDIMHDAILKEFTAGPVLYQSGMYPGSVVEMDRIGDLNGNGYPELAIKIRETAGTNRYTTYVGSYVGSSSERLSLAIIDTENGGWLASFWGIDPNMSGMLNANQPGFLLVGTSGGLCFLDVTPDLKLTSPAPGSRTSSDLTVTWQGVNPGDFTQVYVDGICNRMGNGTKADLLVKPGEHQLVLRSIDEYGRISYAVADIQTGRSVWDYVMVPLAGLVLLALLALLVYPGLARTMRRQRRQRMAK